MRGGRVAIKKLSKARGKRGASSLADKDGWLCRVVGVEPCPFIQQRVSHNRTIIPGQGRRASPRCKVARVCIRLLVLILILSCPLGDLRRPVGSPRCQMRFQEPDLRLEMFYIARKSWVRAYKAK